MRSAVVEFKFLNSVTKLILQRGTLSLIRELHLTTFAHNTTNEVLLHNLPTQYGAQVLPATRIP